MSSVPQAVDLTVAAADGPNHQAAAEFLQQLLLDAIGLCFEEDDNVAVARMGSEAATVALANLGWAGIDMTAALAGLSGRERERVMKGDPWPSSWTLVDMSGGLST